MNKDKLNKLIQILKSHKEIKLMYLFGSRANGKVGPLSDYDFAVYFDKLDIKQMFEAKIALQTQISRLLKTDNVDVVIINTTDAPELKYNIITKGKLIYVEEPYKLLVEPKILNEYFDFHDMLLRYKLTRAKI